MTKTQMSSRLTPKQLAKLELLYKRGEKVDEIAHRLRVTRKTVFNHAAKNGWSHGEKRKEYAKEIIARQEEMLIKSDVEKADEIKDSFLKKINMLENMMNATLRGLGTTPDEIRSIKKQEADRIFSIMKNLKIASEISQIHYDSARRALGLDQKQEDDDLELLPININVTQPLKNIEENGESDQEVEDP